ncbi:MAG: hypothetical protein JWN72_2088 [Thermoleophilia bacterium]|nr:hypothetical protein [Thermoleophilia bacterium]
MCAANRADATMVIGRPTIRPWFTPARGARLLVAIAVAAAIATSTATGATSASIVVTADVVSVTTLATAACGAGTPGATDFGQVQPGASQVTSADCVVSFGSSNDTASLHLYQRDGSGVGMWQPPSGALDSGFSGDGTTTTAISGSTDIAYAVTTQPDGKVIAAGHANGSMSLARYNVDGSLDTTFDGDGKVTTNFPYGSSIWSLMVQPDGKILAGGIGDVGAWNDFAVVRYNTNGSLDTTFDGDGIATTPFGSASDDAYALALQPDGRIVLAGFTQGATDDVAVARFTANGALDTTFGTGGKVTTAVGSGADYGRSLAIQPDGRLIVAGYTVGATADVAVLRYNVDGTLDTSFNGTGKVVTTVGSGNDYGRAVHVQDDGKILVGGYYANGSYNDAYLMRYLANGTLDTTFDGDGRVVVAPGPGHDSVFGLTTLGDGRIVAIGQSQAGAGSNFDFEALRFTSAGAPDLTFNGTGQLRIPIGAGDEEPFAGVVGADGRLALAGYSSVGGNLDFAVVQLDSTRITDFASSTADWTTPGTSLFGACLKSVAAGATTDGTTYSTTGNCGTSNADPWRAIAPSTASGSRIARAPAGITTAEARLRFGLRTPAAQRPGAYLAPLVFAVVAP